MGTVFVENVEGLVETSAVEFLLFKHAVAIGDETGDEVPGFGVFGGVVIIGVFFGTVVEQALDLLHDRAVVGRLCQRDIAEMASQGLIDLID